MSEASILHEYQPGEYCKDIGCPQYNDGQFANECDNCKAFIYYQWLKINGYKLLIITDTIGKENTSTIEAVLILLATRAYMALMVRDPDQAGLWHAMIAEALLPLGEQRALEEVKRILALI